MWRLSTPSDAGFHPAKTTSGDGVQEFKTAMNALLLCKTTKRTNPPSRHASRLGRTWPKDYRQFSRSKINFTTQGDKRRHTVYKYTMPAIRCYHNYSTYIVTAHHASYGVPIRMKTGAEDYQPWLGFICEAGVPFLGSLGFVKLVAAQVSNGSGDLGDPWIPLKRSEEHVLGVRCLENPAKATFGVMAIVDKRGWPIVVTVKGRRFSSSQLKLVS